MILFKSELKIIIRVRLLKLSLTIRMPLTYKGEKLHILLSTLQETREVVRSLFSQKHFATKPPFST